MTRSAYRSDHPHRRSPPRRVEVTNGKVSDAWVSGGCFRALELVVEGRTPEDAAQIVQRICGVCRCRIPMRPPSLPKRPMASRFPTTRASSATSSRARSSCTAISVVLQPGCARLCEPAQRPRRRRGRRLCARAGGQHVHEQRPRRAQGAPEEVRRQRAAVHLLGNWFDAEDGTGYKLPPELDLICTAHYLEALKMQAKASEVAALLGGKMPHVMTVIPRRHVLRSHRTEARRPEVPGRRDLRLG